MGPSAAISRDNADLCRRAMVAIRRARDIDATVARSASLSRHSVCLAAASAVNLCRLVGEIYANRRGWISSRDIIQINCFQIKFSSGFFSVF